MAPLDRLPIRFRRPCVIISVGVALWLRPVVVAAAQLSLVAILIAGWVCGLSPALVRVI